MASAYDWAKLFLDNHKVIITMYMLLFGVSGYTIYKHLDIPNPEKEVVEEVAKEQPKTETKVIYTNKKHAHPELEKLFKEHLEEFH